MGYRNISFYDWFVFIFDIWWNDKKVFCYYCVDDNLVVVSVIDCVFVVFIDNEVLYDVFDVWNDLFKDVIGS